MEEKITGLEKAEKYDEIIALAAEWSPEECQNAEVVYAIGKAYEKKGAFLQSIPWYVRHYELESSDEALGMAVGVCLAAGRYQTARELLDKASEDGEGYYYCAGRYELALRTGEGMDREIETIEAFLDVQEEESYMLRLATLYLQSGRAKEAGRLCKKMGRLFISGQSVDYADQLQNEIKEGRGLEFVQANPWKEDYIYRHVSFDLSAPFPENVTISPEKKSFLAGVGAFFGKTEKTEKKKESPEDEEKRRSSLAAAIAHLNESSDSDVAEEKKPEKKEKKEKIAPIVEKCLEDVVGMQELKTSLNSVFHMMQASKKRAGFGAILKDNLRILGPDGCGKTTAAMAAARALSQIGIVLEEYPVVTDYDTLVGSSVEETHENVEALFVQAENGCILIENIHEFDDAGAYSMGLDAMDQLYKAYMAAGEKIPLIITGSEKETTALFTKKRKFGDLFNLPPVVLGRYTTEELVQIAVKIAESKTLILEEEAQALLAGKCEHMAKQPDFKYSRDLERMLNEAYVHQVSRISGMRRPSEQDYFVIKAEDFTESEAGETVEELLAELDRMTGLQEVKKQVRKIVNQVSVQKLREESGIGTGQGHGSLHLVFLGNAGTGKTTVARIIGKIYKRLGVLPSGQLVECTRRDLVSEFVGATAQKVADKVKQAMGGILFIDEAYTLCKDDNDAVGREAIDALLTDIENHRDCLMVILAGYTSDMNNFMNQNQGLRSRIPTDIMFEDYSTDEMVEIFKKYVKDKGLMLSPSLEEDVFRLLSAKRRTKDFGNARGVRNVFESVLLNQNNRLGELDPASLGRKDFLLIKREDLDVPEDAEGKPKTIQEYLQELNDLTGLAAVKEKVNSMVASVQVNKKMEEAGLKSQGFGTLHMVFKGNAGTGKTTVARLVGGIYKELGVLSCGHLVEVDRSALVSEYVGATAKKVKAKIQEAMGGILFIDEAYALAKGGENDFGKEAIDTLVADIENYRKDLMVIIAGYSEDMDVFLKQNQGLASRFPNEIIFEDYTTEEMLSIFKGMVKSRNLLMADRLDGAVKRLVAEQAKKKDFGNARGIRNLLDKICEQRSVRIARQFQAGVNLSQDDLRMICAEDLGISMQEEPEQKSVEELMEELNRLTGLAAVKEKVNKIVSTVQVNKEMEAMGLKTQGFGTLHMIFKGNAGTGKTTVARLLGAIYKELGVLSSGHLVEVDRSALVGQYIGSTAPKVKEKVKEALGGILFIDEAYALAKGGENDFGKEAIDTLVADIENYRKDFMVIIAGYSEDMEVFLKQNQGLSSRFPNEILFEDYTQEELLSIFKGNLVSRGLKMAEELEPLAAELIGRYSGASDFGNARGVRNLVDKLTEQRNVRIAGMFRTGRKPSTEEIQTVTEEDIRYFLQ